MKKITLSLPDEVYRRARLLAAERNTSVSAMVEDFLSDLDTEQANFEGLRRLQDEVLASVRCFDASDRVTRAEVHQRR